jgi:hypothetical protein
MAARKSAQRSALKSGKKAGKKSAQKTAPKTSKKPAKTVARKTAVRVKSTATKVAAASSAGFRARRPKPIVLWINHLGFLAGDPSVTVSFNAVNSNVGGGLSGLIIESSTTGAFAQGGGGKGVETGVEVPPGYLIKGVRLCYELSNSRSFVSQVRLAQLQNPPSTALVLLDDPTNLTNPGPVCVNSQPTSVDPGAGGVRLSLFVDFGDTSDRIVIRGVGLILA